MTSTQSMMALALPGNLRKKAIQIFSFGLWQSDIRVGHSSFDLNKWNLFQPTQMNRHQSSGRGQNLTLQQSLECLITFHPALLSSKVMKNRLAGDLGNRLPIDGFGNEMNFQSYGLRIRFHIIN